MLNGTTSQQRYDLLTDQPGHDLVIGLEVQGLEVLTDRRLGHEPALPGTRAAPLGVVNDDMRKVLRYLAERLSSSATRRVNTPFDVDGMPFDERVAPALRRLVEAQPPYIDGISSAGADFPIVITDLTERGWEVAETAGDRRDASPGAPASTPLTSATSLTGATFQVALSFAGEQRSYVQRVATALTSVGIQHFYDDDQKVAMWGTNQVETLQRIYLDDSSSVVMFISREYAEKIWPSAERRAALSRALRERREYVLPVRFDDTALPGLDPDVSYLKAADYSPEQLAAAIADKLVSLGVSVPAQQGPTVGWARAASGRTSADFRLNVTDETEAPIAGAHLLAVAANGTFVASHTTDRGDATLQLPARRVVTIFAAHPDLVPALVGGHDVARDLHVTLPRASGVGGAIFSSGTGELPGLTGRLNPIRDAQMRHYLYADNISINEGASQPHPFIPGVPLALEDAVGRRLIVTVLATIGQSSLLRYER